VSSDPRYDQARKQAIAARRRRKPTDPQTAQSAPGPVPVRRTLCICPETLDGVCRCGMTNAWPPPDQYEAERTAAFRRRHPPEA
jgi:hypothetical protein